MNEHEFLDWQECLKYAMLSGRDRYSTPEGLMSSVRRYGTPEQTGEVDTSSCHQLR